MIGKDIHYEEPLPGLRDIIVEVVNGSIVRRFIHTSIFVQNDPRFEKYIRVTYRLEEYDSSTGKKYKDDGKEFKYTLKDNYWVESYEYELVQSFDENNIPIVDEFDNPVLKESEIPDTRKTIQLRETDLTDWDALVGEGFSIGIISRITSEQNI